MKPDSCTGKFNNMSCLAAFDLRLIGRFDLCDSCKAKKAKSNRSWAEKRLRGKNKQSTTQPSVPEREVQQP